MPMLLNLCPTESRYSATRNTSGYLRVELDGGMGRYRKDILDPGTTVTCRWIVGQEHYNYLWAFYRVYCHKMIPFHIDLILEEWGKVRVLANIIPDSFRLDGKQGQTYTVTAQLEVQAQQYNVQDDEDYIFILNELGLDFRKWLERLWHTVNIDYPAALPVPPLYP